MLCTRIKIQKFYIHIGLIALFLFYFKGYSHSQVNLGLVGMLGYSDRIECLEMHKVQNEHNINGYNIYAFCGTKKGLTIIDVTDPNNPERVTNLDLGKVVAIEFYEMDVGSDDECKDFVVVLNARNDLVFFCIGDPSIEGPMRPVFAGRYSILREPDAPFVINRQDLVTSGDYLYVADGYAGLDIVDISDPYEPQYAGRFDTPGKAQGIYTEGNYAYVADGPDGLVIIDITNPSEPFYLGSSKLTKLKGGSEPTVGPRDIVVKGPYAYLSVDDFGLVIFDISDRAQPRLVDENDLTDNPDIGASLMNLAIFDNYAYMAHGSGGLTIIDMKDPNDEGENIDLGAGAYDIAIYEGYAYVVDYDEKERITIFQIEDPKSPEQRGDFLVVGDAQRIELHNEYAYLVDKRRGILEISINDVSKPELEGIYLSNKDLNDISIHGGIAYVPAGEEGIALIDLEDPSRPARYYSDDNIFETGSITVDEDGRYACVTYVTSDNNNKMAVLDISDLDINDTQKPLFVGSYVTDGIPNRIKIHGSYVYVCEQSKGIEIFDISNPNMPVQAGILKTFEDKGVEKSFTAVDAKILGNYAYIAAKNYGLIIADISDPYDPVFLNRYDTQSARGIEISYPYAYIADQESGVIVLDITNPGMPLLVEDTKKTGISFEGMDLKIRGEHLYVAARHNGLIIFRILNIIPLQGNLIVCTGGPFSSVNPLWSPSQALSNTIFSAFKDASYPNYFIYYLSPNPFQDPDCDRFTDPFIVDDFDPMQGDIKFSLTNWAGTRFNTGPLYLYLTGLGAKDAFMISPGEIIKASDPYDPDNMDTLKQSLDTFQEDNPRRDVICLLEFASSGSFSDDLIDPNILPFSRTIITCTDSGTSYLDQTGMQSFTGNLISLFQEENQDLLFTTDPNLNNIGRLILYHDRVKILQRLFSQARDTFWSQGHPFSKQPPQMVTAQGTHTLCSLTLSVDPLASGVPVPDPNTNIITSPDQTLAFIPTGHYLDGDFILYPGEVYFQTSDPSILLITEQGLAFANPNTNFNGSATVLATIIDPNFIQAPYHDPNIPLGGVTGCMAVTVKIPGRSEKESLPMAIIVAGEREEGDYLWEETHTIANYAYTTLLSRGYSRENILYLTHFREETGGDDDTDLDGDGDPNNDIDGAPGLYSLREALDRVEEKGVKELLLFMVNHGIEKGNILSPEGGFFLRSPDKDTNGPQKDPDSILNPYELDYWLDILQGRMKDLEITIIVESCHSGLFIEPLKDEKRVIITSTLEDESYLYANGLVSFSYFLFSFLQSGASLATAYNSALYSLLEIDRFLHTHRETFNETHQKPQLWSQPKSLAQSTAIGGAFLVSQDQPVISSPRMEILSDPNDSPSDPNIRIGQNVLITVKASDLDGIDEVWAMVNATYSPPVFSGNPDRPVVDLPRIDFVDDEDTGEDEYTAFYPGFEFEGPYSLLIFAKDKKGIVSLPFCYPFYVYGNVSGERKNKAVLVAGYDPDPNTDFTHLIDYAEWVLQERGFTDIRILDGQEQDITVENLGQKIMDLSQPPPSRLLIYMIGQTVKQEDGGVCFQFSETECLDPNTFNGWLEGIDSAHSNLILLLDTPLLPDTDIPQGNPYEQTFFQQGPNRINITGSIQGTPYWEHDGYCSFSHFFFTCLLQGASIYQAYRSSQFAIDYYSRQEPALEDLSGNELAKATYISSPFQGKAKPGIIVPQDSIVCGETRLWVQAENADPDAKAWCLITTPSGENLEIELPYIEDQSPYEATYPFVATYPFEDTGSYEVVTFFQDTNGIINYDVTNYTMVNISEDQYENDDDLNDATPIIINYSYAQSSEPDHTFHDPNDQDWVVFHAYPDRNYVIKADLKSDWNQCLLMASLYNQEGEKIKLSDSDNLYFSEDKLEFRIEKGLGILPKAGFYFLRFFYGCNYIPEGACPVYRIKVITDGCSGRAGNIRGYVLHSEKQVAMPGIRVYAKSITEPGKTYEAISDKTGEFCFHNLWEGDYQIYAFADGSHISEDVPVSVRSYSTANLNLFLNHNIQKPQAIDTVNPPLPPYYIDYWLVTIYPGLNLFSCPCMPQRYYISDFLTEAYSVVNEYSINNAIHYDFYMDIRKCRRSSQDDEGKIIWDACAIDNDRSVNGKNFSFIPYTGYLVYLDIQPADHGIQSISLQIPCSGKSFSLGGPGLIPGMNLSGYGLPDSESDSELLLSDPTQKDIETFMHYVPDEGIFKAHYRFFGRPSGNHCRFFKDKGYLIFKNK